ncbi:conserved hypothetical protein [Desulfosarcina cetonica]|nr:conserved hypothetical protein [Desulfosarcina cetonica]
MSQNYMITTKQLADLFSVKGSSIRHSLCVRGHYLGIKPVKLPNGRLMWPKTEANKLFQDEAA